MYIYQNKNDNKLKCHTSLKKTSTAVRNFSYLILFLHTELQASPPNVTGIGTTSNIVVVVLLLTLNIFHIFFWCFYGSFWTSICQPGRNEHLNKI